MPSSAEYYLQKIWENMGGGGEREVIALPATIRTGSTVVDLTNDSNYRGAYIITDITAVPGGGQTIQIFIDMYNPATGQYTVIAQSATITIVSVHKFIVCPGITDTDSEFTKVTQVALTKRWRIRILHSAGGNWNYSVGVNYV